MKNFKLLTLLASVLLFGFYACSDESAVIDSATENQSNALMQNLAKFNSKYAEFDDDKDLVDFYKSYSDLDDVERLEFMKALPYQTLQSFLIELQKPFEGFKSKEEFVNYLNGSDYLKLIVQKDGIDKVVEVSPSYHFAANFINKDKIIKVGNTYRKYFGDFMVESQEYDALLPVNESNFKRSGLQYSKVVEALDLNNSRSNELNYYFEQTASSDVSGCKNDRAIEFGYGMFSNLAGSEFIVSFSATVTPLHKTLFCAWSDYNTDIYWNNFDFQGTLIFNGITVNFNKQFPNETVEGKIFTRSGFFWGTGPVTGGYNASFAWTKRRSSVSHRGMNGVYLQTY